MSAAAPPHDTGLNLPADLRARLADLVLRTRRAPHSGPVGQQASRARGAGIEFAQYRAYEPGDDPRRVDWKLFARADRHYVREAERDSPLTVWLLLDASASMAAADRAAPHWRRIDAARQLAACAIDVALRHGDAFGLVIAGPAPSVVPPATGARQRDRCHAVLAGVAPQGAWPDPARLRPFLQRIGSDALSLLLGDLLDAPTRAAIHELAGAGRELACIQLLTRDEREFPFEGAIRFDDPETGASIECDAATARADYLARFGAAQHALAEGLARRGVALVEHDIAEPADRPLRALFAAGGSRR